LNEIQSKQATRQLSVTAVRSFLSRTANLFANKPFRAHRMFGGGHAQTLAAWAWPHKYRFDELEAAQDQQRLFAIDSETQVLAHCRWQTNHQECPTMVIWHGMEGSTGSGYMPSTALKAFCAGFNVVRVNYRNCGNTENLTPTLYHGGLSDDLRVVINELIHGDGLKRIYPVGFSLGGNMVLKLLGEYGNEPPNQVVAAAVVSPSVDLGASTDFVLQGRNWLYHKNFMQSLKQRIRLKHKLYPDLYDITGLSKIRTIREFDDRFTSIANGFANADDYYFRSSSVRVAEKIRVPTLIIHAKDDPFIPFAPLRHSAFTDNPYLLLVATERGGHVAFISEKQSKEDRFWAENRLVEFCVLAEEEAVGTNSR
jgi:predicted alpha/beta-fold hydrolase